MIGSPEARMYHSWNQVNLRIASDGRECRLLARYLLFLVYRTVRTAKSEAQRLVLYLGVAHLAVAGLRCEYHVAAFNPMLAYGAYSSDRMPETGAAAS